MLLSSVYTTPQPLHFADTTPSRSSPLRESSINLTTHLFETSMSSPLSKKSFPVKQRAHKSNPLIQTRDVTAQRRRDLFFRRVQTHREDKQWEARGDQIQRLDFVSERKRWEAEKYRQAPPEIEEIDDNIIEDAVLLEYEDHACQLQKAGLEIDHILAQEEDEMQYYVAKMGGQDAMSQHFGSDDEDFDAILIECTSVAGSYDQLQQHTNTQSTVPREDIDVDMDTSHS